MLLLLCCDWISCCCVMQCFQLCYSPLLHLFNAAVARRPRCVAPMLDAGRREFKLQFFNSSIFLFLPFENFSDPNFSKLLHLTFDFIQEHENGAFFPMRKAEGKGQGTGNSHYGPGTEPVPGPGGRLGAWIEASGRRDGAARNGWSPCVLWVYSVFSSTLCLCSCAFTAPPSALSAPRAALSRSRSILVTSV